jgi:hypothetical protein
MTYTEAKMDADTVELQFKQLLVSRETKPNQTKLNQTINKIERQKKKTKVNIFFILFDFYSFNFFDK